MSDEVEAAGVPEADPWHAGDLDAILEDQKWRHDTGVAFHFTAVDQRVYLLFVQRLDGDRQALWLLDMQFERYYELEPAVRFLDEVWHPTSYTVEDLCRGLLFSPRLPLVTDAVLVVYDLAVAGGSQRAVAVSLHEVERPLGLRLLAEHVTRLQRYALTLEWDNNASESARLVASCTLFAGAMQTEDGNKIPLLRGSKGSSVLAYLKRVTNELAGLRTSAPMPAGGGSAAGCKDISALQRELKLAEQRAKQMAESLLAQIQRTDEAEARNKALLQEIHTDHTEGKRLQDALKAAEQLLVQNGQLIKKQKEEIAGLEKKVEQMQENKNREMQDLENKNRELAEELRKANEQLEKNPSQDALKAAEKMLLQNAQLITKQKEEIAGLEKKVEQMQDLENKNTELTEELRRANKQLKKNQSQDALKAAEKMLVQNAQLITKQKEEIAELKKTIDEERKKQKAGISDSADENELHNALQTVEKQKEEIAGLEKKVESMKNLEEQNNELRGSVKEMTELVITQKEAVEKMARDCLALKKRLDGAEQAKNAALAQANSDKEAVEANIQTIGQLEAALHVSNEELTTLTKEREELKKQLQHARDAAAQAGKNEKEEQENWKFLSESVWMFFSLTKGVSIQAKLENVADLTSLFEDYIKEAEEKKNDQDISNEIKQIEIQQNRAKKSFTKATEVYATIQAMSFLSGVQLPQNFIVFVRDTGLVLTVRKILESHSKQDFSNLFLLISAATVLKNALSSYSLAQQKIKQKIPAMQVQFSEEEPGLALDSFAPTNDDDTALLMAELEILLGSNGALPFGG